MSSLPQSLTLHVLTDRVWVGGTGLEGEVRLHFPLANEEKILGVKIRLKRIVSMYVVRRFVAWVFADQRSLL